MDVSLTVSNLSKSYSQPLFTGVTLNVAGLWFLSPTTGNLSKKSPRKIIFLKTGRYRLNKKILVAKTSTPSLSIYQRLKYLQPE